MSAIPRLAIGGLKYVQPFLIKRAITYVSNRRDQPASVGWGLAAAYALTYFGMALMNASYHHLLNRCITQVRGGLVSLIYEKTLDISITSVDPAASLTLMSSDVLRITSSLEWFNDAWGAFFELAVALGLLAQRLGLLTIGPAMVFFLSIAGSVACTIVIPRFQREWMDALQVRVSFTSGMLGSMRPIKLLGLSQITKTLTQGLRIDELRYAARFRWLFVIRLIFQVSSHKLVLTFQILLNFLLHSRELPYLDRLHGISWSPSYTCNVPSCSRTFRPYGITDGSLTQNAGNIFGPFVALSMLVLKANEANAPLDLALGFSILSLVSLVDTPLGVMSFSLPMLASSVSCVERIQNYLLSTSRQDNRLLLASGQGKTLSGRRVLPSEAANDSFEMQELQNKTRTVAVEAIVMKECSLGWEQGSSVLKDINLSIQFGEITMLVGPVGCGKSTLLKGMLGETSSTTGFVYVSNVSYAFADQEAWVQNITIRDAIAGTSNVVEESWYHEVLDSCGLTEDLSILPQGDLTVIGSKGISLSGGQKQR